MLPWLSLAVPLCRQVAGWVRGNFPLGSFLGDPGAGTVLGQRDTLALSLCLLTVLCAQQLKGSGVTAAPERGLDGYLCSFHTSATGVPKPLGNVSAPKYTMFFLFRHD